MLRETPGSRLRRALLLISDGEDTGSVIRLPEAVEAAQRSDVAIYAITRHGPRKPGGYEQGDKALRQLADQTGGRSFVVRDSQQLSAAIDKIARDLHAGYTLSYRPPQFDRDGRFRTVQIEPRERGLRVYVRRGYFAPKD